MQSNSDKLAEWVTHQFINTAWHKGTTSLGRIKCRQCNTEIGGFTFDRTLDSCRCPCERFILPALAYIRERIEFINEAELNLRREGATAESSGHVQQAAATEDFEQVQNDHFGLAHNDEFGLPHNEDLGLAQIEDFELTQGEDFDVTQIEEFDLAHNEEFAEFVEAIEAQAESAPNLAPTQTCVQPAKKFVVVVEQTENCETRIISVDEIESPIEVGAFKEAEQELIVPDELPVDAFPDLDVQHVSGEEIVVADEFTDEDDGCTHFTLTDGKILLNIRNRKQQLAVRDMANVSYEFEMVDANGAPANGTSSTTGAPTTHTDVGGMWRRRNRDSVLRPRDPNQDLASRRALRTRAEATLGRKRSAKLIDVTIRKA